MNNLNLETTYDIAKKLAQKFKKIRKRHKLTQKELANQSGVSYASIRRFELTGQISFVSLLDLACIVNKLETIEKIFDEDIKYKNIDEVINSWKK